jgi:hypothetical protein
MSLQKQKKVLQNIGARISKRHLAWHLLSPVTPVALSVSVFCLVVTLHPVPAQIHSQKASSYKNITHHVSTAAPATAKTQPAAPAPQLAAALPASSPATPVKTITQAGTSKPEPVVTPSPSSSVSGLTPTTPAATPTSSQAPSSQTTTGYTSTNWSGYLATNGSFTGISGSWNSTLATGNGSTTSADSTWIGIGGVTSGDLIQVGTQNIIAANGQVSTSAFYELLPSVSEPVPGITVVPGDSMTASLSEVSSGEWTISITDKTNGESYTSTISYASSLSSAEWIEEDPSFSSRRQIPFDNFHGASFSGGSTVYNGSAVNIAASTAQSVVMVDNTGRTIAVPSVIGDDGASFTVTP